MTFPLSRLLPALLLASTLLSVAPAVAQTSANGAPVVDETALRYFARQGDERRLRAEIARLSAIYPGWVPPTDPLATEDTIDPIIQQLWDLYGLGDLDGARALIAERQATEPGWRPQPDFADALAGAEAGGEIRRAITEGANEDVITLAALNPTLLTCENIDLLWGVGEAFAETNREARAVDAYRYLLQNCDNDRLATMQKAQALLDESDIADLMAFERTGTDGVGEFAAIKLDLARRRVAEAIDGIVLRVDPDALAMVEAAANADKAPDDLRLLGYYELKNERSRRARDWFEEAYAADPSPASAEGLAIALLRMNDGVAAEAALADIRDETPEIEALYLSAASELLSGDPPRRVEPQVLERIIEAIADTRSAQVAQDMGWYAYGFGQTQTAVQWFEEALGYDPTFEPAAYGLVVASQKLRDRTRMRQLIEQWGPISDRIRLFGTPGAPTTAPTQYFMPGPVPLFQQAVFRYDIDAPAQFVLMQDSYQQQRLRECSTYVPPQSMSPANALARGWCLLDISRNAEAEEAFRIATLAPSAKIRTDAYYGHTLALLRLDLVDEAAVSASAMPQTPERVKDMQISLLSTTAVIYYKLGRYTDVLQLLDQRRAFAPEENGLLVIRGWSYFHLNRLREAKQIFTAVAATGYQDAQRGIEALAAKGFK
ncbi:MAG: tetratricopeptide repeat protein [Devosia sp.]